MKIVVAFQFFRASMLLVERRLILLLIIISAQLACTSGNRDIILTIPMRDGVDLSTHIFFPDEKKEKYPVVLIRTPYKKENRIDEYSYLVENGYVLVSQDVRGRFASEGIFEPFVHESEDGYDAIEWLAQQPWCDGNIGMIGSSYNGFVQYSAAIEQPPHLKTIIPNVAMVDPFYLGVYMNGVFTPNALLWCAILEAEESDEEIQNKDWGKLLDHSPVSDLDSIVFSKKLDYYQQWVRHDSKDSYWKQDSHAEKLNAIKIPVFIQSGWFDSQLMSSKLAYNELKKSGNKQVKMIIGPWGHTDKESDFYQDQFMGYAADSINLMEQYVRWFDYWLKGEKNGIMDEPLVQLYAMNANKWYNDDTYPLRATEDTKLFLDAKSNANLHIHEPGILLQHDTNITESANTFTYDPGHTAVFTEDMFSQGRNVALQKMLSQRNDYLFYKTESFTNDETILGQIFAKIYASSSAVDTDWFTVLVALDSNDNIINLITHGALRAKYKNGFETPELLEKDKVYEFNVDMNHYGFRIRKGEKLGFIVTSSWGYPLYGKNLNTGENNQTGTNYEVAIQKVYHTKEYSSYISLPFLRK